MELFKIDKQTGELVLSREDILLIKEFAEIYKPNRPSKGDSDGRRRLLAYKEFGYIWYIVDYNSPGVQAGLSIEELHKEAVENFELGEGWIPTEKIYKALDKYKDIKERTNVAVRITKSLLNSLNNSDKIVNILNSTILKRINTINDKSDTMDDNSLASSLDLMINSQNKLLAIASELPKQIKALRESEALAQREIELTRVAHGGGRISRSMIPE